MDKVSRVANIAQRIISDVDHKNKAKTSNILTRLSKNEAVSLDERILVQKYADRIRQFGIGCASEIHPGEETWSGFHVDSCSR